MPFVVSPGSIPPPPEQSTGADGILTATLWPDAAGVLLSADFSTLLPARVHAVRFVRLPDHAVRSGTDALATGNKALAFDHEASVGQAASWVAYPIMDDGTVGAPSAAVTLTLSMIDSGQLWVKSVTSPAASVLATVLKPLADITYSARSESQNVLGSAYPVSAWDVWQASSFDLSFDVGSGDARKDLQACLTSGVVLLQANPGIDFDDRFALAGDVTRSRYDTVHGVLSTAQELQVPMTEVASPSPVGAAMAIPGHTWQDVRDGYTNWNHVNAVVPNWAALATGDPDA